MCLEVSARSKPEGVSFISDSEDAALLQKFEETGEAFVPAIVTRSSIDTLVVSLLSSDKSLNRC